MEGANEHRGVIIQSLGRMDDKVAVAQNPWDHLHLNVSQWRQRMRDQKSMLKMIILPETANHLLAFHTATGDFEVVLPIAPVILGAGLKHGLYLPVTLKNNVHVAYNRPQTIVFYVPRLREAKLPSAEPML